MSSEKLKVLLVPADFYHAEGNIALNLMANCPEVEFLLFAAHDISKRFDEFKMLLEKVDVVHFLMNLCNINFPKDLNVDRFLANLPCASVSTVHHICEGEEVKLIEAQKLDMIHVVSSEWQGILKKEYNQDSFLAHLGVDLLKFNQNITTRPNKIFRIGMFGFFSQLKNRKRFDVFIQGLSQLKTKDFPFEVILQGQLAGEIKTELEKKQIPYKYFGILDSKNAYKAYKNIDCYVIAADVEGGPFSTLESLGSGVPLVTTRVGMSIDVIKDGYNGVFIEKNNPEAICDAIYTIGTDKDFYNKLVTNSLNDVKAFDWRKLGKKYTEMYRATLNKKTASLKKVNEKAGFNILLHNREVLNRDLLRESAFLYKYDNFSGSARLFIKALLSGYSDLRVYKDFITKLYYK